MAAWRGGIGGLGLQGNQWWYIPGMAAGRGPLGFRTRALHMPSAGPPLPGNRRLAPLWGPPQSIGHSGAAARRAPGSFSLSGNLKQVPPFKKTGKSPSKNVAYLATGRRFGRREPSGPWDGLSGNRSPGLLYRTNFGVAVAVLLLTTWQVVDGYLLLVYGLSLSGRGRPDPIRYEGPRGV